MRQSSDHGLLLEVLESVDVTLGGTSTVNNNYYAHFYLERGRARGRRERPVGVVQQVQTARRPQVQYLNRVVAGLLYYYTFI